MDVREFIEAIRKSRDMSFNAFSDTLEYKSKTSLSRLMRGESNLRSMESFCQRVKEHIDLTNEERCALTQIMQIARSGCSETAQEMEAFMRMDVTDETDINLEDNEGRIQTLAARYSGITGMSVLITNCHYVPIYPTICRWLRDQDAHVCHYMIIYDDPARTIHAITALLPIVYEKNYEGYAFKKPTERMVYGMQTADSMIVTYTAPDGGSHEDLILFDQTQHGRVLTADRPNISRMFSLPWTGYETIKRTYFQFTMLDDYLQYSEECAALERDCAQYIIESDPCVNMIPVSVLKAAFVDKCGDVDSHLLAQLVDVYERRFQNLIQKHTATHYIMKRSALMSFVRTGRTQDHFWGMRPYTVEERILILENLIEQSERNPYYHLYFLKDEDMLRDIQICCYEGRGLLILDAQTSFNLAKDHAEILITQNEFLEQYRLYFTQYLLKDSVLSKEQTREFLYECLKYCKSAACA